MTTRALACAAGLLFAALPARAQSDNLSGREGCKPAGAPTDEQLAASRRSFGLGAQTEFRANVVGVPSFLLAWDGGGYQVEGSFGLDVTDDKARLLPNVYDLGLRAYLPVHRGATADFALALGGGVTFLEPATGGWERAYGGIAGGRVRIFIASNAAVTALAGVGVLFREATTRYALGALPLGGAGFIYYFR